MQVAPRDVKREEFAKMVQEMGRAPVKSRRVLWWRDFWFLVDKNAVIYSLPCNII